jgi:hypothetical protein
MLGGCSDGDDEAATAAAPPTLQVEALSRCLDQSGLAAGAARVVGIEGGAAPIVAVRVLTNLTLRAPGACYAAAQCAHAVVAIDAGTAAAREVVGAAATLSIELEVGLHTVSVELRDDLGVLVVDASGVALRRSLTVDVVEAGDPRCPTPAGAAP